MSDRLSASYNNSQKAAAGRMKTNPTGYARLGEYYRGSPNKMSKKTTMYIGVAVLAILVILFVLWYMHSKKASTQVYYF